MKRKNRIILLMVSLLMFSIACSLINGILGGEELLEPVSILETPTAAEVSEDMVSDLSQNITEDGTGIAEQEVQDDAVPQTGETQDEEDTSLNEVGVYDAVFPLPDNIQNLINLGDDSINFQTSLSITEAIDFYRQAFQAENISERTINTAITATTFSLVFDGHPNGTIVIQGFDLGDGTTNINIRFEDV